MRVTVLLLFFMITGIQIAVAERGNPIVQSYGQTIDEMIGEFMREHDIPGMTLAIVQAPYISRVAGYGIADIDKKLLASPKTLWALGNMTQAYTAVAIMQLVEAGKISLDNTIGSFVPDLPKEWQTLTLRQLMAHTSGLPDYTRQSGFDPAKEYTLNDIVGLIKTQPLVFPPGTDIDRSATNFVLLGEVIEKVSGMTYEMFITKGQIEPLGLKNTIFASQLSQVRQDAVEENNNRHTEFLTNASQIDPTEVAVGYVEKDGKLNRVPLSSQRALFANGALFASAEDISLWDLALAGNILLKKPESRAFLYSGIKLNDGMSVAAHCGWRFTGHKGFMDVTGSSPGFSAYLSRFTDKSELVCVTLCANKEGVDLTELARRIAGCFDTRLGPPAPLEVMTCVESSFPVNVTVDRLEKFLKAKGVGIAARVNHAAAAKKVGLDLRPTETLIFGNPAVGTHLMLKQQSIAVDLPLRIAVWQDQNGSVWAGYGNIAADAERHRITDQPELIKKMRTGLSSAVQYATSPY